MNKENLAEKSVSEPVTEYKVSKLIQGIGKDFEIEFAKGLTVEEAKAEMRGRMSEWKWEK